MSKGFVYFLLKLYRFLIEAFFTHEKRQIPTAGAHEPTFFSLRGPAKALHQRAREAREYLILSPKELLWA